jgi:hypothetical protein
MKYAVEIDSSAIIRTYQVFLKIGSCIQKLMMDTETAW